MTRLNYLGDWGTQFGLLRIGLKFLEISEEQLKENPVQKLYDAYVKGEIAYPPEIFVWFYSKKKLLIIIIIISISFIIMFLTIP